jgi:hypothetical protein
MKKKASRLKLTLESLRVLDSSHVSGGAFSGVATCAPSCPPSCGTFPVYTGRTCCQ